MNQHELPSNGIELVKNYLLNLQNEICERLEQIDEKAFFITDEWQRPQGGGGITRALANGGIFEKAGVNYSQVNGDQLPPSATAQRPELAGCHFDALGVSLVIHPHNPYIPTTHANVRFFLARNQKNEAAWWFGGGFDLTPYYPFEEDCIHWHQTAKAACDPFGTDIYPRFKKWCDDYFFLSIVRKHAGSAACFLMISMNWVLQRVLDS